MRRLERWWSPPRVVVLAMAMLLSLGSSASAAAIKVRGEVVDSLGEVVAAASVLVEAGDGSRRVEGRSDGQGRFRLKLGDVAGEYRIRVSAAGFAPFEERFVVTEGERVVETLIVLMGEEEALAAAAEAAAAEREQRSLRLYNEGATAYNAGEVDRGVDLLRQAVDLNPRLAIAWAALARIHLEERRWEEAAAAAAALVELAADRGSLVMLYDAYRGLGDGARLAPVRRRLVDEFPSQQVAVRVFNEGVEAWGAGERKFARSLFSMALEVDPQLDEARLALAQAEHASGEWEAALTAVEEYLARHSESIPALELKAAALQSLGRQEEAGEVLAKLRSHDPATAVRTHFEEGVGLFHAGRTNEAVEALRLALKLDPNHAASRHQLGLCLVSLGRNQEARRELERYLELAPEAADVDSVRRILAYLE